MGGKLSSSAMVAFIQDGPEPSVFALSSLLSGLCCYGSQGLHTETQRFCRWSVVGGEAPRRYSSPLPEVVIKWKPYGLNCPCTRAHCLWTDVKDATHLCWSK